MLYLMNQYQTMVLSEAVALARVLAAGARESELPSRNSQSSFSGFGSERTERGSDVAEASGGSADATHQGLEALKALVGQLAQSVSEMAGQVKEQQAEVLALKRPVTEPRLASPARKCLRVEGVGNGERTAGGLPGARERSSGSETERERERDRLALTPNAQKSWQAPGEHEERTDISIEPRNSPRRTGANSSGSGVEENWEHEPRRGRVWGPWERGNDDDWYGPQQQDDYEGSYDQDYQDYYEPGDGYGLERGNSKVVQLHLP